ncbi:MAG: peptidase C13 [Rhodanobacter sp. 68-29]|nr:peptidase C13 [Rhodanobacter sp.]ODU75642.1 MAG: peptidase C13 [Rhodanobacter sp. SCN 69-32]OJY56929.1 MAG: peptidase C13 [Rhodanobacter sp. 68-29]
MSLALALALWLLPSPANAGDDFAARVRQAKMAEAAATGPAYQKALWGRIGNPTTDAYKACLAANHDDKSPFTLVLDVDAHGKPQRIVAQPATPVASCMAARFAAWTLPAPPPAPAPYPLEIDFSVAP